MSYLDSKVFAESIWKEIRMEIELPQDFAEKVSSNAKSQNKTVIQHLIETYELGNTCFQNPDMPTRWIHELLEITRNGEIENSIPTDISHLLSQTRNLANRKKFPRKSPQAYAMKKLRGTRRKSEIKKLWD